MNKKLEAIAAVAAEDMKQFVAAKEQDILEAWTAAEEEAKLEENKPKLRLGFSITLDLEGGHQENALSFGIRRRVSRVMEIPDPNQIEMPLEASANSRRKTGKK